MTITESKLKTGKLTLGGTGEPVTGGVDFACQATNVRIVPTFNDESDAVETLCGDKLAAFTTTDWALQGTSIQDFDDPDGFIKYTWDNNLTETAFSWQPNTGATVFSGTVQIRALEVGGDVNSRITTDFDWPITGDPEATWPAPVGGTVTTQPNEPDQDEDDQEEEEEPVEEPTPEPGETTTYST
jgi:hypothetical protein